MDDYRKTFIEELQSLEEPTKKKILVITTIVIMIVVVYLWLAYFNGLIVSNTAQTTVAAGSQAASAQTSSSPGFWGNMKNGAAIVSQSIFGGIVRFGQVLNTPRQYIVKPTP